MIEGTRHKAVYAYSVGPTPRRSLLLFLGAGFVLAVVSLGYLAALPSDSSDPFLGRYSAARVILERIRLEDTIDDLQMRGLAVVVGTDLTSAEFPSIAGTIWDTVFDDPGDRIAEFGEQALLTRGEPKPNLYLFAARVRKADP
jgi:hypothetical protein